MHLVVLVIHIFRKYCIRHILCGHRKIMTNFNNISDRFRNISAILQYFQGIFLQYCLNILVLCGYCPLYGVQNDIHAYSLYFKLQSCSPYVTLFSICKSSTLMMPVTLDGLR